MRKSRQSWTSLKVRGSKSLTVTPIADRRQQQTDVKIISNYKDVAGGKFSCNVLINHLLPFPLINQFDKINRLQQIEVQKFQ